MVTLMRHGKHTGWRRHLSIALGPSATGKPQAVRPDFAFPKARLALFVDGCFWHRCPIHFRLPSANGEYWEHKIQRNVDRDRRTAAALRRKGWKVVRVWEHELKSPERVARRLVRLLS